MIAVMDTTAFSAAMRGDPQAIQFLKARRPAEVATVPPVVAEIAYGIQRTEPGSRKRALLEAARDRLLRAIAVLPWTMEASMLFGSFKAALEQGGITIDDFDVAIAAMAYAHGAEVITTNLVHFRRIEGLSCRHWSDSV